MWDEGGVLAARRGGGTVQSITTTRGRSEIATGPNQLAVQLEPFLQNMFFFNYLKKGDTEKNVLSLQSTRKIIF